jgi:putative LysE/RhtB family amino acid efflux pump
VDDLLLGAGLGLLVAMQLGPMSLLLIRTTLRSGLRAGVGIGLGIAAVDTLYAGLGAAGLAALLTLPGVEQVLGLLGAGVLVVLGLATLRAVRRPLHDGGRAAPTTLPAALRLSLLLTAANPLTIASWAGVFAAASVGGRASVPLLVAGVGVGSLAWVLVLAGATSLLRQGVGPTVARVVDTVAGLGLVGFGLALGARVLL